MAVVAVMLSHIKTVLKDDSKWTFQWNADAMDRTGNQKWESIFLLRELLQQVGYGEHSDQTTKEWCNHLEAIHNMMKWLHGDDVEVVLNHWNIQPGPYGLGVFAQKPIEVCVYSAALYPCRTH